MTFYLNVVETHPVDTSYNIDSIIEFEETREENDKTEQIEKKESSVEEIRKNVNKIIQHIFNKEDEEEIIEFEIATLNENYFYNQLSDNQKIIYTALKNNIDNLMYGNYKIEFGNTFTKILSEEGGNTRLGNDYQTAIEAFTHDYPEIFYIDVNKMYINIETTTKMTGVTYNVFISPGESGYYYDNDFSSYDEVIVAKQNIEFVKNSIIENLNGNTYQKVKTIHDYLVNNIEYDSEYKSKGRYSIYGALVKKNCVCEGYAKAFKYIANAAGINAEILQGESTNSYGQTESHAWNCVQIGNVWYQIDVTWDDPVVIGNGRVTNKVKYKYFLKGSRTFEKDHKIERQFTENGKVFLYPELSLNDYE